MLFNIFHEAIEKTLDRHVFTHEFALNIEGLKKKNLKKQPPIFEEILNLIQQEKLILIKL